MPSTVLVVDDEPDMLELLSHTLRLRGYVVITAGSGGEALNEARRSRPDIVLLDLMLPDLDGISVCELLRRLPSTSEIPVVVLTAKSGPELPETAARAGAADLVRKPFETSDLVLRIKHALALAEARRETDWLTQTDGGGGDTDRVLGLERAPWRAG